MIFTDSRYANGIFFKSYDQKRSSYNLSVLRQFPVDRSNFYYYVWRERDRVDRVAAQLLGDSNLWWRVMDYNPEIIDPVNIPAGTLLRIPYDS
jgi:hypothetical protein